MSDAHSKSMVLLIALVLVILAGALCLVAKPMLPTPAPVVPSAGPAATTTPNPVLAGATSSTQAKITWSPTSTEVILSPGDSTSKGVTFHEQPQPAKCRD